MTTDDIKSLTQFFADKFYLSQPALVALILLGTLAWICWRTRSWHVLLTRIWRVAFGKMELNDSDIALFAQNRHELVAFRFISGIRPRTLSNAKRLIRWSEAHDEEMGDIKACGHLFDLEACRLREDKIPRKYFRVALILLFLGLCAMALVPITGCLMDRAAYRFTQSGTWFLLSDSDALPLLGNTKVTKDMCAELVVTPKPLPPYSKDEVKTICEVLDAEHVSANIQKTVVQQRFALSYVAGILLYLVMSCLFYIRCVGAAQRMKKRLDQGARLPRVEQATNDSQGMTEAVQYSPRNVVIS